MCLQWLLWYHLMSHAQLVSTFAAAKWSTAHTDSLVKLYDEMVQKNPKAYTAQRMVLNFVDGKQNVQPIGLANGVGC